MANSIRAQHYLSCCVQWPHGDVNATGGLCDMIEKSMDITLETFRKRIGSDAFRVLDATVAGGVPKLKDDWHVRFYRSKWHSHTVYFLVHSGIEYVYGDERALEKFVNL